MSPWISESNESQTVDLSHINHTISMVEENALVAHSFFLNSIFIFLRVRASHQESTRLESFHHFPQLARHNELSCGRIFEVKFLSNASCQVNQSDIHSTTMQFLVTSMKLSICFLKKRDPELIGILTVSVERMLASWVERHKCIDKDASPLSILKELKHTESILQSIIDYQVL